jgi:hypothetical protein
VTPGVGLVSRWPISACRVEPLRDVLIDHIFFRAGREDQHVSVEATALGGDPVEGVIPSDHRALICDLRWQDERAASGLVPCVL